ncbi:MAG: Hydantoinase/oxoprolinase N-terminal region, partial [Actinomycetia bacterium]|nr:Hydantoinase/oxoprolinase N-terminal region [Actinomycetes bacterium]
MTPRYLGIDVGGTNSKLAVLEVEGEHRTVLSTAKIPTGDGDPVEVVGLLGAAGALLAAGHG